MHAPCNVGPNSCKSDDGGAALSEIGGFGKNQINSTKIEEIS